MRHSHLAIAVVVGVVALWSNVAMATITQGDFSVFGFFETRWAGRWGEAGAQSGSFIPKTPPAVGGTLNGRAATVSGGSFDFYRWDLVEARTLGDIRPDYHTVKNYKFMGRIDTLVLKDADFFAFYRPWYDAVGDMKPRGTAQTWRDDPTYDQQQRQAWYHRNDLREYYGQLNFTDNFSVRIGKQQIIWSEADALSGTELTNTSDLTYHWTHFESPENLRKNLQMVKFNYIFPDYFHTANNEAELCWIPGDYQGDGTKANVGDPREPYIFRGPESPGNVQGVDASYNSYGQPIRHQTFADEDYLGNGGGYLGLIPGTGLLAQENIITTSHEPSHKLGNSEFAMRLSSLLPIGNGLQTSFIYLYEARNELIRVDTSAPSKGLEFLPGVFDFGPPRPGVPAIGTLRVFVTHNYKRNHFFGVTGTYYDKDLTDIVYRYDALYAPKVGVAAGAASGNILPGGGGWTNNARFILAGDRPTYIPWISKQHTFFTFQYVNTWYPSRPALAHNFFGNNAGKLREESNFAFFAATNWLLNGQLTSGNVIAWDIDNTCGDLSSTNVFRYSRNVLMGFNAIWYIGRSGRYTDPFVMSRMQRASELEMTLTYEI